MKGIIYRVVLKVGYYTTHFEFKSSKEACDFAGSALSHMVSNEDTDKPTYVTVQVVNVEAEVKDAEE